MYPPDNLDALLAELRATKTDGQVHCVFLDPDDLAFVQRILDSITTGSQGVFVVRHPDDRMQYMCLNANNLTAITLVGEVMARLARRINDEA
jgi:hypothetical protein